MKIKWIGHSGFIIDDLMIDPWLIKYEAFGVDAPYKLKEEDKNITTIVITHSHEDHLLGVFDFAKEVDATIVGTPETVGPGAGQGCKAQMLNIGGPISVNGWEIRLVQAFHTGNPTGAILKKDGLTIYHAGDTGLFSDMKMIGELFKPDIAILPIGGRFTMDEKDAALASKWIGAKKVIPAHYNTFPLITADPKKFEELVLKESGAKTLIFSVGEEKEI